MENEDKKPVKNLKIQKGKINTKKLVNLFGTDSQKTNYAKNKKLPTTIKEKIIKRAKKFCDIVDLGKGEFEIKKVRVSKYDDAILELKTGLYQYLTPLILNKLLNETDENEKISLSFMGWANRFDIVNDNYSLIKYNQDGGCEYLNVAPEIMDEYFSKVDDCIKGYLERCIKILSNPKCLNLVVYNLKNMARFQTVDVGGGSDESLCIECKYEDRELTDSEVKFVSHCEEEAMIKAGITAENQAEKYYGKKSTIFKEYYYRLLMKKNILFPYTTYNIYCKSKKRVQHALSKFDIEENVLQDFNKNFIPYIQRKAEIRQDKAKTKAEEYEFINEIAQKNVVIPNKHRLLEDYLDQIQVLTNTTIGLDANNLKNIIGGDKDTLESIIREFNIEIKKIK